MQEKEIEKVLEELQNVRPEVLNDEAKRLFDAIMSIADQRDDYKLKIEKAIDKLYSWGEVLDPIFQKEMLEILKVKGDEHEKYRGN